jgi:hypothetical protein
MKSQRTILVMLALSVIASQSSFAGSPYSKNAGDAFRKLPEVKKVGTLYLEQAGNPKVLNPLLVTDVTDGTRFRYG